MIAWKRMESANLHKGAIGYVEFYHEPSSHVMILCRVADIKGKRIEIVPVASDRTCLWIDSDDIYIQTFD